MSDEPTAVLLTGVFGAGKSTVLADLADVLDDAGVPSAAIDLDWLTWTNVGGPTREDEHRMMLVNLASVIANYRERGATHIALARSIRDRDELDSLRGVLAMPMHVVELAVPYADIERRLATDPTDGRALDLACAAEWMAYSIGSGLADVRVDNCRPVRTVTLEILGWLGWPEARPTDDDPRVSMPDDG